MFSSELDRVHYPLSSRSWGIGLGSIIVVAVTAALVSARTVPYLFAATVAGFLVSAIARGQLELVLPRRGSVFWHLAVFLLYALVSAAWSINPAGSALHTCTAILIAFSTLSLVQLIAAQARHNLVHMGEGLWIGFVVGLVYLAIEFASDQSIKIWLFNAIGLRPHDLNPAGYFLWSGDKLIAISSDDLSRNMAPLTLFLWPALLAMGGTLTPSRSPVVAVLTLLLAAVVVMVSLHETSKLAFVGGVLAFGLAHLSRRLTGRLMAVAWVCASLAVLPSALLAHRLELHNASWLQGTARHRIIIWNYTAEQTLKAPLLGVGARTTYVRGPREEAKTATASHDRFQRTLSLHSHNVYLQTWFELGLIGATLLTLVGLAILRAILSLAPSLQPYAYATFASAAIAAASSYGMWQFWFMAMFGYCAVLFGLGSSLVLPRWKAG